MQVGGRVGDSLGLLMVRVAIANPVVISSQDSGKEKEKPCSSLSGKESSPPNLPANFSSAALATIVSFSPLMSTEETGQVRASVSLSVHLCLLLSPYFLSLICDFSVNQFGVWVG